MDVVKKNMKRDLAARRLAKLAKRIQEELRMSDEAERERGWAKLMRNQTSLLLDQSLPKGMAEVLAETPLICPVLKNNEEFEQLVKKTVAEVDEKLQERERDRAGAEAEGDDDEQLLERAEAEAEGERADGDDEEQLMERAEAEGERADGDDKEQLMERAEVEGESAEGDADEQLLEKPES